MTIFEITVLLSIQIRYACSSVTSERLIQENKQSLSCEISAFSSVCKQPMYNASFKFRPLAIFPLG